MSTNAPIGEVECPHKGCAILCNVYRFRARGQDEKRARFAGKLYADCPTHGRIGADGRAATQEYILCHAKMFGPEGAAPAAAGPAPASSEKASASTPISKPSATSSSPVKTPATSPEKSKGSPWLPLIR